MANTNRPKNDGYQPSKVVGIQKNFTERSAKGTGIERQGPEDGRDSRHARDLLQNAESFFQEAVSYTERGAQRDWVFAIVNLAIALELTLEAVLQSDHWALVFEDINDASKKSLRTGDFRTVTFSEALRRAQEVCEVRLDAKDLRYLGQLNELRNRVLHFEFDLNIEQAKGLVARGLNIFNHLMTAHLRRGRNLAFETSSRLAEFERYVRERMRRLARRLAKSRRPPSHFRECEKCGQDALIVRDGLPLCLYCGNKPSAHELALNSEGDFGQCPNCEHGRLGLVLWNNDEGEVLCVFCGFRSAGPGRNRICHYCGEVNTCHDCLKAQLDDD